MFSERVLSFQKVLFGAMFGVTYLYSCRYFSGSFRLIGGDNFASANRTSLFISMISAVSGLIQYINYFDTTCEVFEVFPTSSSLPPTLNDDFLLLR